MRMKGNYTYLCLRWFIFRRLKNICHRRFITLFKLVSLSAPSGPSSPEPTTDEVEEEQQLYESLLDKHIERKVNASLRRTLQQESRRGDAPSPSPLTGSSYGPHAGGEAHQPKVTGEIIA
jgi:hypothetical protein